jgi:hypothetical protein
MAYSSDRLMFDADSHVMETPDWIERHADPAIRDRLHPLGLGKAGTSTHQTIQDAIGKANRRAESGRKIENVVSGGKGWHAPGACVGAVRSKALVDRGVRRQRVFSRCAATE